MTFRSTQALCPMLVLMLGSTVPIVSLTARSAHSPQVAASPQDRLAALKKSLQDSQTRIRGYEWVETTIISLKGEEKSRRQQRCYYGADGALQKVPIGDAPAAAPPPAGGRRGGRLKAKIVENKKDDMKEYMERAAALIHQYLPPNPADIQRAQAAGHVTIGGPDPKQPHVDIADYLKPGDRLSIELDAAANRLLGLSVSSYLDKPDEVVSVGVEMASLPDGTSYTAQTTLDATAKNIRVVIQNAGYRHLSR